MSARENTHRFAHEAMATVFEIRCDHEDGAYAAQAAHAAFALVDRLEQELSLFVPNSDVSRINALAAGAATKVSPSSLHCLEIARDLFDLTGGAFDVSLGSGLPGLELDPAGFTVRAHEAGVRLDLGGIGKGCAVDLMAELLEDWGVVRALVHGGQSSVVALEPPRGELGWPLTLSAPFPAEPRVLARISARQQALSASGTRKRDHIQDPRTQEPVRGRAAWAAVAGRVAGAVGSEAAAAEGFSTAFMVLAREEIGAVCAQCPGLEAWALDGDDFLHYPPAPSRG